MSVSNLINNMSGNAACATSIRVSLTELQVNEPDTRSRGYVYTYIQQTK